MVQPPPRPRARLSHLVGPGPAAAAQEAPLSLGLCNPGDAVAAVELSLELAPAGGAPLARGAWRGLLPAGARRELGARVAWARGELELGGATFAFERGATPDAGCVARARLRSGALPEQVLEVGLRAPGDGERR